MRKAWAIVTANKRRKILASVTSLLVIAGTALGFYIVLGAGSGTGTQPLGTATTKPVTVSVTFAPGLMPGQSEPFTVTALNPGIAQVEITKASITGITTDTTGCLASWFSTTVDPSTPALPVTLPAQQTTGSTVLTGTIKFTDTGTDQTVCSGGNLSVSATAN